MKFLKRAIFVLLMISIFILTDQLTKYIAYKTLHGKGQYSFFFDTFRLVYAENTGAFLSFGANFPFPWNFILFILIPIIFLIFILWYLIFSEKPSPLERIALILIAGGGISNLIDRVIRNHYVIDFMNFGIGPIRTGILNVADIFITSGFIILLILSLPKKKTTQ